MRKTPGLRHLQKVLEEVDAKYRAAQNPPMTYVQVSLDGLQASLWGLLSHRRVIPVQVHLSVTDGFEDVRQELARSTEDDVVGIGRDIDALEAAYLAVLDELRAEMDA